MNLFFDTNALIMLYHYEDGTIELTNFLSNISNDFSIIISDLTKIEFHSAILKRLRMKEISLKSVQEIFEIWENDFLNLNIIEIEKIIKERANQLLNKFSITCSFTTLDALQLSSALLADRSSKIDYFISFDKKLTSIAQEFFEIFGAPKI